jgi:UDP-N-acetylmuramate dehydrogenase
LLVGTVRELALKIKVEGILKHDEPMRAHTSFHIGGPAELYATPRNVGELARICSACKEESIPFFLLGGGSNILVSDKGIRGMVIDLGNLRAIEAREGVILAECGALMSSVSETALANGLAGLETFYTLPGSVGGAAWMNARCYGTSMSDILSYVEVLNQNLEAEKREIVHSEWGYKLSPFQNRRDAILKACFQLNPGKKKDIEARMSRIREDRDKKGHFFHPSAGSVFKNNVDFGAPTGKIIETLGLKGTRIGDAQIAPYHGNIIVNLGEATAADVLAIMNRVERAVHEGFGFRLEREIILVGEW